VPAIPMPEISMLKGFGAEGGDDGDGDGVGAGKAMLLVCEDMVDVGIGASGRVAIYLVHCSPPT
jgi:hypothetical protein